MSLSFEIFFASQFSWFLVGNLLANDLIILYYHINQNFQNSAHVTHVLHLIVTYFCNMNFSKSFTKPFFQVVKIVPYFLFYMSQRLLCGFQNHFFFQKPLSFFFPVSISILIRWTHYASTWAHGRHWLNILNPDSFSWVHTKVFLRLLCS